MKKMLAVSVGLGLLAGAACSQNEGTDAAATFAWPASLTVMGDGYPAAGDDCRRLGESAAVADYLDHTATLVGCPGPRGSAAAQALLDAGNATVVDEVDGVTVLSIVNPSAAGDEAPSGQPSAAANNEFKGSVTGNGIVRHTFTAREGQTINVSLAGEGTIYFNVLPPDGTSAEPLFVGSRETDSDFWAGVAPASGEYTVLVYLMGNDKDAGATRAYVLEALAE